MRGKMQHQNKKKKAESLERLFSRVKNFGEFRKKIICNIREAQLCLRLSKSLPFSFYTKVFIRASVADWQRQIVCKPVALHALLKVQIFPDAPIFVSETQTAE